MTIGNYILYGRTGLPQVKLKDPVLAKWVTDAPPEFYVGVQVKTPDCGPDEAVFCRRVPGADDRIYYRCSGGAVFYGDGLPWQKVVAESLYM